MVALYSRLRVVPHRARQPGVPCALTAVLNSSLAQVEEKALEKEKDKQSKERLSEVRAGVGCCLGVGMGAQRSAAQHSAAHDQASECKSIQALQQGGMCCCCPMHAGDRSP